MDWYQINNDHRPEKGHAIYVTTNPKEGGIACHVKTIDEKGFSIASEDGKYKDYIEFDSIEKRGNLYAWDRDRLIDFPDYDPYLEEE